MRGRAGGITEEAGRLRVAYSRAGRGISGGFMFSGSLLYSIGYLKNRMGINILPMLPFRLGYLKFQVAFNEVQAVLLSKTLY